MPYIEKPGRAISDSYRKRITKKEEAKLRKKGYKPYGVDIEYHAPRGEKIKIWAKSKDAAWNLGESRANGVMMDPDFTGGVREVKIWKRKSQPKSKVKRKGNPDYVKVPVIKTHPKSGKKYAQMSYVRKWSANFHKDDPKRIKAEKLWKKQQAQKKK